MTQEIIELLTTKRVMAHVWEFVVFLLIAPFIVVYVKAIIDQVVAFIMFKKSPFSDKHRSLFVDDKKAIIKNVTLSNIVVEYDTRIEYIPISRWRFRSWKIKKEKFEEAE